MSPLHRSPATPTKSLRGDLSPGTGSGSVNLSDPEVMARIGNRAIKTVQKPSSKYTQSITYKEIKGQTFSKLKLIHHIKTLS